MYLYLLSLWMESKRLTIQMNPVGLYTFQNSQLQLPLQELLEDHFRVIVEQKMGIILG